MRKSFARSSLERFIEIRHEKFYFPVRNGIYATFESERLFERNQELFIAALQTQSSQKVSKRFFLSEEALETQSG